MPYLRRLCNSVFNLPKGEVQIRSIFIAVAGMFGLFAGVHFIPYVGVTSANQQVDSWPSRSPVSPLWSDRFQIGTRLASGHFLVASQKLMDPNFSETVVLLVEYGQHGAMGVIINRPTEVKLATVLPDMQGVQKREDTVFIGGPVARSHMLLLIRSGGPLQEAQQVFGDVYISGSRAALQRLIDKAKAKERVRVYAGHAGWGPGQLDHEVARGDWLVLPADADNVFDKAPADIWLELLRRGEVQQVQGQESWNRLARHAGDTSQIQGNPHDPSR